ncbi:MAG: hypothetical protein GY765_06630 [bacterium]|nr:hypothetical protein [bacterium]
MKPSKLSIHPSPLKGLRSLICFIFYFFFAVVLLPASATLFYSDRLQKPGSIYYSDGSLERTVFSAASGYISSAAIGPGGILYFADSSDKVIYRLLAEERVEVYRHTTNVRDIGFDRNGRLYFSQASIHPKGLFLSHSIFRVEDGRAVLHQTIDTDRLNGNWDGNFAFSPSGSLYLSTGGKTASRIYTVKGNFYALVHQSMGVITAFDFHGSATIFYTDGGTNIYTLDLKTKREDILLKVPARSLGDITTVTGKFLSMGPEPGRVNRIALHPTDPDILYAGSASGGVFRSGDRGLTWEWRSMGITDGQIGGIMVYGQNPQTVFAVTQSGIFRSQNEGVTWSHVLKFDRPYPPLDVPSTISHLVQYPIHDDANLGIFAAPYNRGLYRSTDGGTSWTQVFDSVDSGGLPLLIQDIEIHEANDYMYIARYEGISRSDDGGATWRNDSGNLYDYPPLYLHTPVRIKMAPTAPETAYAAFYNLHNSGSASLYRREYPHWGWVEITPNVPKYWADATSPFSLAVSPVDKNTAFLGQFTLHKVNSPNPTTTWEWSSVPHVCDDCNICGVDFRDLVTDDRNPCLYAAHDQGIFRYQFQGATYHAVDKGIVNTQIYSLDIGPGGTVYTGTQDRGAFKRMPGEKWNGGIKTDGLGDVLMILAHPQTPGKLFIRVNASEMILADQYGQVITKSKGLGMSGFWNNSLAYFPKSQILYAASTGIYKSENGGREFKKLDHVLINDLKIRSLGYIPHNDKILFAGAFPHGLFKTVDGGKSWQRLDFPKVPVLAIKCDQKGQNIFAGTSEGIYLSTDGGAEWTEITRGLPDRKVVSTVAIDPGCPDCIYIGLGFYNGLNLYGGGVYVSKNKGQSWSPALPYHSRYMTVTDIRFDPVETNRIWVSTFGSGVLTLYKD